MNSKLVADTLSKILPNDQGVPGSEEWMLLTVCQCEPECSSEGFLSFCTKGYLLKR